MDSLVGDGPPHYVLTLHEGVAMAMADGYAITSGRPAVVSVHATPGVTNLLGGLFLAQAHRSPVVVLAGQQDSRLLGRRPFLASDFVAASAPYVEHAQQVGAPEDAVPALDNAFRIALRRRGPVLVAVPRDFYVRPLGEHYEPAEEPGDDSRIPPPDAVDLDRAAELVLGADRLVLLSGNEVGARGGRAVDAVVRLAEMVGARVHSEHNAVNMHFPSGHPLYLGGNAHGMASFRPWLRGADVVVAIGCDLFMEDAWSDEPILPPEAVLIQVNEEAAEVGRLLPADVGIPGDIVATVTALSDRIRTKMAPGYFEKVAERKAAVAEERRAREARRESLLARTWNAFPIHMTRVYAELRQAMDAEDVMVDEAVNMASYLHEFFPLTRPGTLVSSKQSWLGWGWGAAMGVQLARFDRRVVLCIGDGSAAYAIQALWTAQRYGIPIKAVVLNNGRYMAVANHLRNFQGRAAATGTFPGTEIGGVDFVAVAGGFGVAGRRVVHPDDLPGSLEWMMASPGPAVLEVMIDPEDAGLGRDPIPAGPGRRP